LLAARGHDVRVLGWSVPDRRIEDVGCRPRPFPSGIVFDPLERSWEERSEEMFEALVCGPSVAEAVLLEAERERVDVLVVDLFLANALSAGERLGVPTAALVHVQHRFFSFPESRDPEYWGWDFDPVNATRIRLGLDPIPRRDKRIRVVLAERCECVLFVMPEEFDDPTGDEPRNAEYVGPLFEEETATVDLPWPADHPDPLVVVSLGTTYMHHEDVTNRVLQALDELPVRVLVTLGGGLEPHEISVPDGVEVGRYVPHVDVLPGAGLVVTHAGMGTVMAAFACGVPMVCLPFGRDQPLNAERVEALGAGLVIDPGSSAEAIRAAAVRGLASEELRSGAHRMSEIVAGYRRGALAVQRLEGLLSGGGEGI
jgi:MGT family glycosyltransferase